MKTVHHSLDTCHRLVLVLCTCKSGWTVYDQGGGACTVAPSNTENLILVWPLKHPQVTMERLHQLLQRLLGVREKTTGSRLYQFQSVLSMGVKVLMSSSKVFK